MKVCEIKKMNAIFNIQCILPLKLIREEEASENPLFW